MGFESPVKRQMPPFVAGERDALNGQLDFHRATVLSKLEGLQDPELRRVMVPSGLSLMGLLKHHTEAEHLWFARIFARVDEPALYAQAGDDAEFVVHPEDTIDALVADFLRVAQRSRDIVAAADLDDRAITGWGTEIDLRGIIIHMIEETARHNGHADIIRELIDGTTGF
jgi:uncharacterized damage-inducible protein DinB